MGFREDKELARGKFCAICGSEMKVEWSPLVFDTMPPMKGWYWICEHGHPEAGGMQKQWGAG